MFSFDKQVDFFKKKINLPSETYRDLSNDEHDWAFIVAGATNMNIVADFREAVGKAIEMGTTIEEFRKDFRKIVKKHGWTYNGTEGWRTRIIYDTNLTSSYQAGRYEQLQEVKEYMPYWEYVHTESKHERKAHKELDGIVLPADHEFWNSHYPPNGYGCKCTVHAHNEHTLKKQSKTLLKDKKVEVNEDGVPLSVHPSFNHTPSKNIKDLENRLQMSRAEIVADLLFKRAVYLDPMDASVMVAQLLSFNPAIKLLQKNIEIKVARINDSIIKLKSKNIEKIEDKIRNMPKLETFINVGIIPPNVMKILQKYNADIKTSVVSLAGGDIAHSIRSSKKDVLTTEDFINLPIYLQKPEKVFIDYSKGWKKIDLNRPEKIVFLIKTDRINEETKKNFKFKLIIRLNTHTNNTDWKFRGNPIITGAYQSDEQLKTTKTMVEIIPNDKYGIFKQEQKK